MVGVLPVQKVRNEDLVLVRIFAAIGEDVGTLLEEGSA